MEDQHALLVAERDERHRHALALGEIDLPGRIVRGHALPRLVGRERARLRRWTEVLLLRGFPHALADLAVRGLEHPVPQKLVDRRQTIELKEANERPQRRSVDEQRE